MSNINTFKTSYLILKESALIVESFEGSMTFNALLQHKKKMLADIDYDTSFDVLTDLSNVYDNVSDTELLSFLANTKGVGLWGKGKNAVLFAPSKNKSFNEQFAKLASFLSIDYNHCSNLDLLLDYLDRKDLKEKVDLFLEEKRDNKDFEWVVMSNSAQNIFKRISQLIISQFESRIVSDEAINPFAVEYKIFPQHRLIVESYSGVVALEDLGNHAYNLSLDPDYDNSYDHLLDVRKVYYKMSINDLAVFAEIVKRGDFADKKKFGVWIATQNQFEFNKMFSYIFEGFSLDTKMSKNLNDLLRFTNKENSKSEINDYFKNIKIK